MRTVRHVVVALIIVACTATGALGASGFGHDNDGDMKSDCGDWPACAH